MVTGHWSFYVKMIEKLDTVAGVFRSDQIHFLQNTEHAKRNILQISDWRGT